MSQAFGDRSSAILRGRHERHAALRSVAADVAEIAHGALLTRAYTTDQQLIVSELVTAFKSLFERRDDDRALPLIEFRPELRLGRDVLVPDFAVWLRAPRTRSARADALGHYSNSCYAVCPDWICEILLVESENVMRTAKLPLYAAKGVRHAWLLEPRNMTLEVLEVRNGAWERLELYHGRGRVHAAPLDEIEIDLAELWPSRSEWSQAIEAARAAVGEELEVLSQRGLSEIKALGAIGAMLPCARHVDFEAMHSPVRLLRAWSYIERQIHIEQALSLARLEIAAEANAHAHLSKDEHTALYEEHMLASISCGLEHDEDGSWLSLDELKTHLEETLARRQQERLADSPPLRAEVEAEVAQYTRTGELTTQLRRRVIEGPGTRFIARDVWSVLVSRVLDCEAASRTLLDTRLGAKLDRLRQLYEGVWLEPTCPSAEMKAL